MRLHEMQPRGRDAVVIMNSTPLPPPPEPTRKRQAVQDCYPDDVAHCFGCGRLNGHGHHIRTYWDGDETVSRFLPEPYHTAVPGFVYGGILASLVDCHGTGTAAAAASEPPVVRWGPSLP